GVVWAQEKAGRRVKGGAPPQAGAGDRRAHAGAAHRAGAGESAAGLLLVACGDPEELFAGKPWVCCLAPFVPAKAGTQGQTHGFSKVWVPACAGTNGERTLLRPVHLALMLSKEGRAHALLCPDWGRAGESPSLFPPPRRGWARRAGGAEGKKPRRSARPRLFPLSRSTVPGPRPARSSRRGFPGVRPGVQLRTTPAGAASRPTFTTPHESAPQWTGRV